MACDPPHTYVPMTIAPRSTDTSHEPQLPPLLREAVAAHQSGQLEKALPLYRRFVDENPRNPTALQLLGVLQSQRGEYGAAIALMRESLRLFPEQAEVANNLGNALSRSGRLDEAVDAYAEAVRLKPRYTDALRNLGLALLKKDRSDDAANCFQCCVDIDPGDAAAWLALGNVHRRQHDIAAAIRCYRKALEARPDYADAHHNLGVCLRLQNRPGEALGHYEQARRLGLDRAELHHNRGNALADTLQIDAAIDAYRAAVERNPGDLESHRNLNSLLWQQELLDDYLGSYRDALRQYPAALHLRLACATALSQQGAFEDAERVLREAPSHQPVTSELKSLLAYTLEGQGRWDEALELHAATIALPDSTPNQRISYARALLACRRPDEALEHAKIGAAAMPFNQRALAYLGLCWRLLGDERDEMLNDYERMVKVYDVPVPASFSNTNEFNEHLNAALDVLHFGKRHPPEQTLRGGTQSAGDLFVRPEQEIQALVESLRICVNDYIATLPRNPEHPLLSRRGASFDFSASWSVRLRRSGYHTMHMHPLGWISSAYYVQLPPEVADSAEAAGGGLKFGEPDIDIGEEGRARRHVQPAVGRLVLFPSYMWHGTIPFESDQPRTTVAFDVVPSRAR